jgi:hypothetical protein
MSEESNGVHPSAASWVAVVAAWMVVGVPLLWGILITFKKAALLLR